MPVGGSREVGLGFLFLLFSFLDVSMCPGCNEFSGIDVVITDTTTPTVIMAMWWCVVMTFLWRGRRSGGGRVGCRGMAMVLAV
ncbi:pollen-specific leucine-rich repeat extensin-like protein 4 [Iris pallida]|uniref:Pollen-specific leucine-rich repeat extensin-like protein 4 n=1 Tax=Iris pallida TaxID=29817 RepID=A0AAX6E0R6_IRIPA|nr:pollen-specific leucine-rich repeat extensin-like protein 4 [Iris pallida]